MRMGSSKFLLLALSRDWHGLKWRGLEDHAFERLVPSNDKTITSNKNEKIAKIEME
jgi:hypothetical protein